jgi:hypothetical protein
MDEKIKKIVGDFKSLQPYFEKLEMGAIPQIEIDILKSKLQNIYEGLASISQIQVKQEISKESSFVKPNIDKVERVESKTEILFQIEEEKKVEAPKHNEILPVTEPKISQSVKSEMPANKEILAEKFKKSQPPINELLAQSMHKKDLSSVLQTRSIKDIEAAIDVNERFLFIRELFNGDSELYSKTIRNLNSAGNFNEAFNYIHQTYTWNLESETAQHLLDLVRRRYIVDEE